jgi:hypothetical protein
MYAAVESIPKEWSISREPIPQHKLKRYRRIV